MRPKIFVAIALMLSLLVAGLILVLGLSSDTLLPVYLLLFLLIFFAICIFLARDSLGDKIFAASIILVLLALSATLFLTNLKTYHQILNEYGALENSPEIQLMQSENDYYSAYASYLSQRVLAYQEQSKIMENQLIELERLKLEQAQQASIVPSVPNTTSQITLPEDYYITYYPEDYGEENDD